LEIFVGDVREAGTVALGGNVDFITTEEQSRATCNNLESGVIQ
jgi:hypothetical protein